MEKDVLLRITDYVVEFKTENGTKQANNHLNLTIHKGESLGLVGRCRQDNNCTWCTQTASKTLCQNKKRYY